MAPAHVRPDLQSIVSAAGGHIAVLGNFPPRRCGIATFTHDSVRALQAVEPDLTLDIYAMDDGSGVDYPAEVTQTLPQDEPGAYMRLAERINASGARLLWIQHEYGIFGGAAGSHLLALIDRLTIPYVATLHTVLEAPSPEQRRVLERLIAGASGLIVMADQGCRTLMQVHGVEASRITVIPHGAPDRPLVETGPAKAALGLGDRSLILTFGLLSPGKGLEDMIAAMPAVVKQQPDALYLILGQTHPHLIAREGEAYRDRLAALAAELGVSDAVRFENGFVSDGDLMAWLEAADVYVTPYRNPDQVTSGTLSYAVALGKPVVSTPYVHAQELLADGHGKLVPFEAPASLANAVGSLLSDDAARRKLSEKAYARGRETVWPSYARSVLDLFGSVRPRVAATIVSQVRRERPGATPIDGLLRLTDDTGIVQHSLFDTPDRSHGYCIDDNARALMLMSLADDLDAVTRRRLTSVYAGFVQHGWNPDLGQFRNFMGFNRSWLEDVGSPDSNGRTLWALGVTAARHRDPQTRRWALGLFDGVIGDLTGLTSPRAQAFCILACDALMQAHPRHGAAERMMERFSASLLTLFKASKRPDWVWFESVLAYDNARLPEALIRAGRRLKDPARLQAGLEALDWLDEQQRGLGRRFRPVGTASFSQPYQPPCAFDQQPVEAWAMIDACEQAFDATRDPRWIEPAHSAWRWYLGENDLGLALASGETGECFDGLTPSSVNLNSGAESVLAWQFADRAWARLEAAGRSAGGGSLVTA